MISSIYIKQLFGLYTYTLNMKSEDDDSIRFLTGPNGYGKTTILKMLVSIYSCDFKTLAAIPFENVRLDFDDSYRVNISRVRVDDEDASDDEASRKVELYIKFYKEGADKSVEVKQEFKWESKNVSFDKMGSAMFLYFKSHPLYHIKDQRLRNEDLSPVVSSNASKMRNLLKDYQQHINNLFISSANDNTGSINKSNYNSIKKKLEEDIELMLSCGLMNEKSIDNYSEMNVAFLVNLSKLLQPNCEDRIFLDKLKCFQEIINGADFANKQMQLSPRFGYRFRATNEDGTILMNWELSSGEQHMLIMIYDLLFNADEASLVLIDEPELSFHVVWQMDFLNNLKQITQLRSIQCIVCTHCPEIFNNEFSLAVDLYAQSNSVDPD